MGRRASWATVHTGHYVLRVKKVAGVPAQIKLVGKMDINQAITQINIAVIQSLSHVCLFVASWTAAHQTSLSFTIPRVCSNLGPLSQ